MSVGSAISQLNGAVNSFESSVGVHVQNVDASTRKIQQTAESVYQRVDKFRTEIMHGEEKQIAHENIMRIDQIIKEQFGNYDAIRKTIMGVVRDFDINLVRNSTIEELSEELWITSSRYWLSYALLAVTAWVNNYPDVARNALSESSRKDAIKTSLFFCLLNLRFERIQTAREWFKVYCRTLDPTMLQQETAVMIQAFMGGVFGNDKQLEHEVIGIINEWIQIISENAQISQSLIDSYEAYFENFNITTGDFPFQAIGTFCENANDIHRSFIDVTKYNSLISLVESLAVEGEMQSDENYKARVDAVLTSLITNYDAEERELKNEQQYFRLIVENEGNVDTAQTQFEEIQKVQNESYNIGKQMVDWVIYGQDNTDVQVRKFGLQSTKQWFESALDSWTVKVRERCPLQYRFAIDEWRSVSNGRDLDQQRTALVNFFDNNKFRMIYLTTVNIALMIVAILGLAVAVGGLVATIKNGFNIALIIGFVMCIAGAVGLVICIGKNKTKYEQRVNQAVFNLEATMAQIVEFQRYFTENIRKKDDVISRLMYI